MGWDRNPVEPHSYIRWGMLAERGTGVGVEETVRVEGRQYEYEVVPGVVGPECTDT
jgi:hypothetical protein